MEVCNIVQEEVTKIIKINAKKKKCLSEEALEIFEKRSEAKQKAKEKRKDMPI